MKFILILLVALNFTLFAQDGLVKTYFNSGKVESEIFFKNNVRDGESKFYYENGNIKEEKFYVNGKLEGVIKNFYDNGKLKEVYTLTNGKREGNYIKYDSTGNLVEQINYKNGIKYVEPAPVPVAASDEDFFAAEDSTADTTKFTFRDSSLADLSRDYKERVIESPTFYTDFEIAPQPARGMDNIKKRLIYPKRAKDAGIQGLVQVEAMINEWGDVTDAKVIKGLGYGLDEAAQTVIYYTKFKPALIKGQPVGAKIVIPVEFKLSKEK